MSSQSIGVLFLACSLLWGGLAPAVEGGGLANATVAYVAQERIYLDAGARDGLQKGELLWIESRGIRVARIEIHDVSDHGAVAILRESKAPVRVGDIAPFNPAKQAQDAPKQSQGNDKKAPPGARWNDGELATYWTAALEATPPTLVRYRRPEGDRGSMLSISLGGETEYRLYSYIQSRDYTRHEQRFTFWTQVDNLGVEGLGLRLGGSVYARYDNGADLYLPNKRAYPLIRDVALTYLRPKGHFFGAVGRFTPSSPIVHTIDGVEAGVDTELFTLMFFGGLKPAERDLAPTLHHQTFGTAARLRPIAGRWRYEVEGAVLAEVRDGRFCRTAVGLDNRVSRGDKFSISEMATFDFIQADDNADPRADFAVSLLDLASEWRLNDKLRMDVRGRYDERALFAEDVETVESVWVASLRGDRHGQVEMGLPVLTGKGNQLRPFLFTRGDIIDTGIDKGYSGGGLMVRDPSIFKTRTGLTTTLDYGFGTGHLANFDLAFDTPFLRERLRLLSGLYTTWSWADRSEVHTLRHFLYLMLRGTVLPSLDVYANLQATYDHALVRLTYTLGSLMQLHVGATYVW